MSTVYKMDLKEPSFYEPVLTVVDTLPEHVRFLGQNLRDRDIAMAGIAQLEPHVALWRLYKRSIMCKTVFVGDEAVAIWGVMGTFLGRVGKPWLVCSPYVEDYPRKLAFRYRSELRNMLKRFLVLEDWVKVDDDKTLRLMEILGFKLDKPEMMNGVKFVHVTLSRED